jgi:hypothetical protein
MLLSVSRSILFRLRARRIVIFTLKNINHKVWKKFQNIVSWNTVTLWPLVHSAMQIDWLTLSTSWQVKNKEKAWFPHCYFRGIGIIRGLGGPVRSFQGLPYPNTLHFVGGQVAVQRLATQKVKLIFKVRFHGSALRYLTMGVHGPLDPPALTLGFPLSYLSRFGTYVSDTLISPKSFEVRFDSSRSLKTGPHFMGNPRGPLNRLVHSPCWWPTLGQQLNRPNVSRLQGKEW